MHRTPGLKDSTIPAPYACPKCGPVDGANTSASYTGGRVVTVHNRCKSEVAANPALTAHRAQSDDFADLLDS